LVTDSNGNPVANKQVSLGAVDHYYYTGTYAFGTDKWVRNPTYICLNEDSGSQPEMFVAGVSDPTELNGIIDGTEDANKDGQLQPGNVATVPSTVETDSSGFANFDLTYPKENGNWAKVRLEARVSVAGSESSDSRDVLLPVLAQDLSDKGVDPPGGTISKFGASYDSKPFGDPNPMTNCDPYP